jgi:hypothetical protein
MCRLLDNRRGSVAFATVVALIPLIGFVALGAEAGSWYVTKQHAQNAADAAAYSGALRLACQLAGDTGVACTDTTTVDYRGKQFAAQNAFCNTGDTSYPGSICPSLAAGTSQNVDIAVNGKQVTATVSQTQSAYLAALLGLSAVTIGATAVAEVDSPAKPPCILALADSITGQGSPTVSSPTCGIASNKMTNDGISFTGNNGIQFNVPAYTAGGCTQTSASGTQCTSVQTYQQAVPDPLSGLDAAMEALKTSDFPKGQCKVSAATPTLPAPYEAGQCYNAGNGNFPSSGTVTLSGTYYFSGNVKISGAPTIKSATSTGATLIFFGGATLSITGNPIIQLTAMKSPSGPSVLSSVASLMKDLLIYDGEAYSKQGVNISGDSSSYFNGTVYVPNSPVTYGGNSSASAPSPGCYQVIAYAVNFQGNTTLDNTGCISDGAVTLNIQTVRLVQ